MAGMDRRRMWRALWWSVAAVGAALLAFMVTVEGEPGALPLALVLAGGIGLVATRAR